mgnify:CR=1 FL=1
MAEEMKVPFLGRIPLDGEIARLCDEGKPYVQAFSKSASAKAIAQAMDRLKEAGGWMVGLEDSPKAQPPDQLNLKGGIGLVVGNEATGLRRLVREKCDLLMRLPMQGRIDSLNAAVAGSIALYLARQARD